MTIIMWILSLLLGLIVIFLGVIALKKYSNTQKYLIRSNTGIQKMYYLALGGIEQYIQIRGQDLSNPIMLVVHGGPGNNSASYSYYWQAELEYDYTIVHWDQRGSGNTYYRDVNAEKPTFDLLLSDLDELVDYLCAEYSKRDVIILGHSWGTVLGGIYASKHPEKLSAYIGIGQFTDSWQGEQSAAWQAIGLANATGKTTDATKIEKLFQHNHSSKKLDMLEFLKLRELTSKYLPGGKNTPLLSAILFSPYRTFNDIKWLFFPSISTTEYLKIQMNLYDFLYSDTGLSMYDFAEYNIPVVIISGNCDWITPCINAQDYFNHISAPQKRFVLLENMGHIPFIPGLLASELQAALRDIQ